jgi:hypothetical protein
MRPEYETPEPTPGEEPDPVPVELPEEEPPLKAG